MAKDDMKASEMLLYLSRVWLFMAIGALVLYFIVYAVEQRPQLRERIYVGYHVPVEPVAEVPLPDGKET